MKKIFLMLLSAASWCYAAEIKPIDPSVKMVLSSPKTIEPVGDFFRATLLNSDSCLRVDKVNVRAPGPGKVKEIKSYCGFSLDGKKYSLQPDQHQDAEFSALTWSGIELKFNLSYVTAAQTAPRWELKCTLDPSQGTKEFNCLKSAEH